MITKNTESGVPTRVFNVHHRSDAYIDFLFIISQNCVIKFLSNMLNFQENGEKYFIAIFEQFKYIYLR